MAEAHAAVAFSFSVTQEGLNVQISHEAMQAVYFSGVRSWRKRLTRFRNRVLSGVFPVKYTSLVGLTAIVLLASFLSYDITWGFNEKVHGWLFSSKSFITWNTSYLVSSTLLWLLAVLVIRYLLKLLLCYQGWMFEPRGKMSLKTKLWAVSYLQLLCYFTQNVMFLLIQILSFHSSNRWEQYVYLAGRGPIMVNSNYYGMDLLYHNPTPVQASRAANIVHAMFAFRSTLDKELIKPIKVNGVVPLCSAQYERVFNSCRTPGVEAGIYPCDFEDVEQLGTLLCLKSEDKEKEIQGISKFELKFSHSTLQIGGSSMYILAGRGPIMVNSNYYGMDLLYHNPTPVQASRAANIVHAMFAFRSTLDKELIKPIKVNGVVPLCSAQYERVFNSCRTPGVEADRICHWSDCRHIAVYHQGRWFKMTCYKNGVLLEPSEMEIQIESILNDTSPPCEGEEHLAALTAGERIPWAKARNTYFVDGVNKKSLHAIEKAAFILVLDDEEHVVSDEDSASLSKYGRSLLHGKCYNRWFDKTFNCIVFKNGRWGINAEHSWADAPIMSYVVEEALGFEYQSLGYTQDGRVKGRPTVQPITPHRLQWQLTPECQEVIETSLSVANNLADDVHLNVSAFKHFGKGLVKKFKMSPDAFIQAALQIAHLRDKGRFSLTYEASMTRLFREGRTETVRSCTSEMCAFAKSMEDDSFTNKDRYALLKKAVDRHINGYKEAMTGQGIDRHIFCLYVVSKYLKLESPFLQKVLSEVWRLSTSQTPVDQVGRSVLRNNKEMTPTGGGFGPVADDGYGVSYIICHENLIMFHVSSKYSSSETDSDRFAGNIEKAMLDLRNLCESM
uniref:carnitine O-palmitoyltransferase 1, muscle isoform n=1 Tax=Ciona intestinalis TaxID=7719 RepID=UPI000EF5060F|nr:carnitine O-palmitoyltransferase 1, muscle isoform [Ciona intestinalis]|eukprot:XP_026693433.1 carnitine O-palmitoyltransferase 1, muscle isoform [Ciona intestinalis]